jgi:hypothetical protein
MPGNHDVLIPRWAIEAIIELGNLYEHGSLEGAEMWGRAHEAIEHALKADEEMVSRLNDGK